MAIDFCVQAQRALRYSRAFRTNPFVDCCVLDFQDDPSSTTSRVPRPMGDANKLHLSLRKFNAVVFEAIELTAASCRSNLAQPNMSRPDVSCRRGRYGNVGLRMISIVPVRLDSREVTIVLPQPVDKSIYLHDS